MLKKLSKNLQFGDKVIFADLIDTVVNVEDDGSDVLKVTVLRRGVQTFFYAGKESEQDVVDAQDE